MYIFFFSRKNIIIFKGDVNMVMNPIAENRYLRGKWVCMSCNATMRGSKQPIKCRKCGLTQIRQKKKQRKK